MVTIRFFGHPHVYCALQCVFIRSSATLLHLTYNSTRCIFCIFISLIISHLHLLRLHRWRPASNCNSCRYVAISIILLHWRHNIFCCFGCCWCSNCNGLRCYLLQAAFTICLHTSQTANGSMCVCVYLFVEYHFGDWWWVTVSNTGWPSFSHAIENWYYWVRWNFGLG